MSESLARHVCLSVCLSVHLSVNLPRAQLLRLLLVRVRLAFGNPAAISYLCNEEAFLIRNAKIFIDDQTFRY